VNFVCCAVIGYLLQRVYARWGFSLSNRADFGRCFILLSTTTALTVTLVTTVQSNLAAALALVGAMSIVRFRAAIKEPEELCFLFMAIASGVGFGVGHRILTLVAFVLLVIVVWIRFTFMKASTGGGDYHVLVTSRVPATVGFKEIQDVVLA